jgi:hypothetical protein
MNNIQSFLKVVRAISKLICEKYNLNIGEVKELKNKCNYTGKWEAKNEP